MKEENRSEISPGEEEVASSSPRERASLLASVIKHRAQGRPDRSPPEPPGPKPLGPRLVALVLSTLIAAYFWLGSPFWLEPEAPPFPTPAQEAPAVRAVIWLGLQQVAGFTSRNGRVPSSQELGPLPPGVTYQRLDAQSYLLVGEGVQVTFTYSSGEPLDELEHAVEAVFSGVEDQ